MSGSGRRACGGGSSGMGCGVETAASSTSSAACRRAARTNSRRARPSCATVGAPGAPPSASWRRPPRCATRRHTARARRWTRPSWTRHPPVWRGLPEAPRPSCPQRTPGRGGAAEEGWAAEEKRWRRHPPGHPPRVLPATPHVRRRRRRRRQAPAPREQGSGRAAHACPPGAPRRLPRSPSPRAVLRRQRHRRLRRRWHQRTRRARQAGVPRY